MVLGVTVYADQIDKLAISEQQLHSLKSTLSLNRLKQHLLKVKNTVQRNLQFLEGADHEDGKRRRKTARDVHKQ